MPRLTRQFVPEQVTLAVLVCSSVGSFALSHKTMPAWLLLLPCVISLFWRIERVPGGLLAGTRYVAWAILGGTVVLGVIFMAYPVLSAQTANRLTLLVGYGLALFSTLFLLGTRVWTPASSLFPAALGTLVVASFNPGAPLHAAVALAGCSVFAYLSLRSTTPGTANRPAPRVWKPRPKSVFSAVGVFLTAWAIIRLLPWAQLKVEGATARLLNTEETHYSSLAQDSRLGDLERLMLSKKVVMRVWTSTHQKLRGRVFTRFDGEGWHSKWPGAQRLPLAPPTSSFDRSVGEWLDTIPGSLYMVPGHDAQEAGRGNAIRTRIVQSVFNHGMLVSPGRKLVVRLPSPLLWMDDFEGLTPHSASSSIEIYGIINRREGEVIQTGPSSPQIVAECLALPGATDPRLKELAARLATGTSSSEERVRRTVSFVQNECRYSLEVGEFHTRQPVAEFLFSKKRGYCQYFASAAAMLLRLQGVPCRYVTGFNVQDGNRQGDHYVVREADAHAWIEAYLPGIGWIEADPTPEAEYLAVHADLKGGWLDDATEWMKAQAAEISIRFHQGDWLSAVRWAWRGLTTLLRTLFVERLGISLIVLVLLSVSAALWVSRRKRNRAESRLRAPRENLGLASPELTRLISNLDNLWAHHGFTRPASRAPLEYLNSIPPEKIPADLRDASRKIVEGFYRSCFGGARLASAEIAELQRALELATTPSSRK